MELKNEESENGKARKKVESKSSVSKLVNSTDESKYCFGLRLMLSACG